MKIKDIPRVERPREKLIKYGPQRLSNSELLAIILGSGKKGENVLQLAKKILKNLSPNKITCVSVGYLTDILKIGQAKACQIVACFELGKRFLKNKTISFVMAPKDVWKEMKDVRNNKKEYFVVFYLDSRNQLIKKEVISIGTLNTSLVHPREVFEPAIKNFASQIIISHNHPSGENKPSTEDIQTTKRLVEAGKILGIEIIDHVIVTNDDYFSFQENQLIKEKEPEF